MPVIFDNLLQKIGLSPDKPQVGSETLSIEQKQYLTTALRGIPSAESTLFQAIENRLNEIYKRAYNEKFPKHIIQLIINTLASSSVLADKQKRGIPETSNDVEALNTWLAKLRQQIL